MKRILFLLVGVCALGGTVFTTGCGPGLVAAGGGSIGAIFGINSGGDDDDKGGGGTSTPTTNVAPAVIVSSLTRQESPATISYLILDANNDPCTVDVQYSVGGGAFTQCFEGGGDGTTGLSSSAGGTPHTFDWDFAADLTPNVTQDITIRIRANDGQGPGSWAMLTNQTIGNEAPTISNVSATGTDVVLLSFDLTDATSDLADIDVKYSIDQGQNFIPVDTDPMSGSYELIGNPPVGLLTSPTGSPGQFIWASQLALSDFVGEVLIQLSPSDKPSGYSGETSGPPVVVGPFPIDNSVNGPPELTLQSAYDGLTITGRVPISITLADDESDAAIVQLFYSTDGGMNFSPATLVNQFVQSIAGPFLTSPSPTPYQIVWDALADFGAAVTETDVVLRLQPKDANDGSFYFTDAFTVIGNEAPDVLEVEVLQDSGNVPVVVNIYDKNSHPVAVDIDYTTDINAGTVVWTPLSVSDFVFGNPSNLISSQFGADNVLVWDTNIAFPNTNEAAIVLRITPTDDPLAGTAAAQLTGSTFITSPFPIINNAAGATPISIDIFTTDSGQTPLMFDDVTVTSGGTVYLDRLINPSTAVSYTTFWKIIETNADYGQLLTPGGGSLTYSQGSVTVSGAVVDGHLFSIHDGLNVPQTFEFDDNSVTAVNSVPVDITGLSTQDEFAQALTDAINANPFVRINAVYAGTGVIQLTHQIACVISRAASLATGGNAADMTISAAAGTVGAQMSGGDGIDWVRYEAPSTPPAGTDFVTLICEIDDPAYFATVNKTYRLYWGDAPTSVDIQSPVSQTLVGTQVQLTSEVFPTTAPQLVTWEVVGGSVNGTITQNGLYSAPTTVPAANAVTIRGFCVDPSIAPDTVQIVIQPYPSGVVVSPPADNPPNWVSPDLRLGNTLQFSAVVSPAAAPQGVNWRIIWNGADQGSGNSTVGSVDTTGFYTAPNLLPSPDNVRIEAVSQVLTSVFGGYTIKLVAPPPTSFAVSPNSATVYAGGAGQQFTTGSFVPTNANTSVTWEMSPAPGPTTGNVNQSGFYTPPASTSTAQVITITARSAAATTVTASATVDLQPNVIVLPTGVTISPGEGITISAAQFNQPIDFNAVVSPPQASQQVNWTIQTGGFGSIDANTGVYTPSATNIDRVVTIRATTLASPPEFDEVDVYVAGDGVAWSELNGDVVGRGDPSTLWDSFNERLWFIGGHSESSAPDHETTPLWIDFTGSARIGKYEAIAGGPTAFSKGVNSIMAVYDDVQDQIYAIVAQGSSSDVRMYRLDATKVDPPGSPPEMWQAVSFPSTGNVPKLGSTARYHCWWDSNDQQIQLLVGNTTVYRFDTAPGGTFHSWLPPVSLQSPGAAPVDPQLTAHAFDSGGRTHYFVGAKDGSSSASNEVWKLERSGWKWTTMASTGTPPARGLVNPSMYFHADKLYVFGGRQANQLQYNNNVSIVSFSGSNADWTPYTNSNERPLPRGDAGFALDPTRGEGILFGGELPLTGCFGDIWRFDEGSGVFTPENAVDVLPQGREYATGAFVSGEGLTYGGVCEHGVSNELWAVSFNQSKGGGDWLKISATGDLPPPLWGASACYDPFSDLFVMFGGDKNRPSQAPSVENRVWTFDPNNDTWTEQIMTGGPSPRRQASMCFDESNDVIWVFGGTNGTQSFNDVWYIDVSGGFPGTWHQATATSGTAPDPRFGATIGFDTRSARLLVMGGNSNVSGSNRQLYEFKLNSANPFSGSWQALSPIANTGHEENVDASACIYDDEYRRFVHTPAGRRLTQGVVLGTVAPVWHYMTPPPLFNNATAATGLYDPATGRYYSLFGSRTILSRSVGTNGFRTFRLK